MPWEKGKSGNPEGRKGYELEQEQLDHMRRILDKDLKIIERLQDAEEINPVDREKLMISQSRVAKYLDKLHATKQDITSDGKQINISIAPEIAEQNGINQSPS